MSDKWYWILILNFENVYTLNVGSQIQTKMYILICNLPSDLWADWLHSLTVLGPLLLAVAPPARAAAGVGPALAHHRCCRPDLGPTLDRPESLSGRWWVAGRGLCVNCSLHLNMQNIIISVKTIIIIIIIFVIVLCQSTDFFVFKPSPASSALWTQHCAGGKKTQICY